MAVLGLSESKRTIAQQREEALESLLLAEGEKHSSQEAKEAIAYWQLCRGDYERLSKQSERCWKLLQGTVIIFGVVATFAGAVSIPQAWDWLGWIRGVPAAIVTIAAGILSSFSCRENATRYEVIATDLWNELARFKTGAAPYQKHDEAENAGAFVDNVCRLVGAEVREWSVLAKERAREANALRSEIETRKKP
jgi:hypothetical protein